MNVQAICTLTASGKIFDISWQDLFSVWNESLGTFWPQKVWAPLWYVTNGKINVWSLQVKHKNRTFWSPQGHRRMHVHAQSLTEKTSNHPTTFWDFSAPEASRAFTIQHTKFCKRNCTKGCRVLTSWQFYSTHTLHTQFLLWSRCIWSRICQMSVETDENMSLENWNKWAEFPGLRTPKWLGPTVGFWKLFPELLWQCDKSHQGSHWRWWGQRSDQRQPGF